MAQSVVNSFSGGMHSGVDPSIFPAGSYREMRNGQIFSRDDHGFVVTNISAPTVAFNLTEGYMPIGSSEFNGVLYIVSYNAITQLVEIGTYSDKTNTGIFIYEPINTLTVDGIDSLHPIPGRPLRFKKSVVGYCTDQLIEVFSRKSFDESVNLYLCDGVNTNIVINTGQTYVDTIENPLTINDVSQFKSINKLPILTGQVQTGGYLKPGSYFVAIRYTTSDLNSTMFVNQIGPFIISDGNTANTSKGLLYTVGESASRSIALSLDTMPEDYRYFEIAIIHYFGENGALSYETNLIANKYSNKDIIIDGREQMMLLTVEDLLANNLQYNCCKTHAQSQGRYFGANWKTYKDLHSKLVALSSKIIPFPVYKHAEGQETTMIDEALNRNYGVINALSERKYKSGEIYPFAVSFIIDGKYQTDAFPVCGYDSNVIVNDTQLSMPNVLSRVKENIRTSAMDYSINKGLLRFPFAMKTAGNDNKSLRRNLFYNMIGVSFDFTLYKTYLDTLTDINITGIILMQGERIENCVAQGINVPLVDRIAVEANARWKNYPSADKWYYASQVVALGNGKEPVFFPYLVNDVQDDSFVNGAVVTRTAEKDWPRKFQFPVQVFSGYLGSFNTKYGMLGYVTPYFKAADFTEYSGSIKTGNLKKYIQSTKKERNFLSIGTAIDSPTIDSMVERETYYHANSLNNISNYAFMSPDNNYGAEKTISGMIRSLQWIDRASNNYLFTDNVNNKSAVSVAEPNTSHIVWNNYNKAVLYALKNIASDLGNFSDDNIRSITPGNAFIFVDDNQVTPDDNGYISRMKSIFEVFGELGTDTDTFDDMYFVNNIQGKSREKLTQAGIMLNLAAFKQSTQQDGWALGDKVGQLRAMFGVDADSSTSTFNRYMRDDFTSPVDLDNWVVPCFVTNLGMKSRSYYGFNTPERIGINKNYSDFISEIYRRDPDTINNGEFECYLYYRDHFNNLSEKYTQIKLLNSIPNVTEKIYAGDVFAQTTTFRLNRYSTDLLNAGDFADDYRHGQVAQLYMESFKNHALRCVTPDDMFYPLCEKLGQNLLDFAYKNSSERFAVESNTYNEGYHELQGPMIKSGVDVSIPEQTDDKVNRIYWSDVYNDGQYEDSYRLIKSGQYADFGPEYGQIHRLMPAGETMFIIQDKGIQQIFSNSKLQNSEDGSSIILGDTDVLSPYARVLASFGTQHPQSVVQGERGVYGVDWAQRKIWIISMKTSSAGNSYYVAEDLLEAKSLRMFFKDLDPSSTYNYERLENLLYGTDGFDFRGVVCGADAEHKKIYFTFHTSNGIETLVYSEQQDMFIGYYDYTPNIYLPYRSKLFKYDKFADQTTGDGLQQSKVWALEGESRYSNFSQTIESECIQVTVLTPVTVEGVITVQLEEDIFEVPVIPFDAELHVGYDELTWAAAQVESCDFGMWEVVRNGRVVTFIQPATTEYEQQWSFSNTCGVTGEVTGFFRGEDNPFKLVFYVNGIGDKNLSNLQKEYLLHKLFASDNLLKNDTGKEWVRRFQWETEYQVSGLDLSGIDNDKNDVNKFWKTPIFEDHMWNIPIDVQSSEPVGPNGDQQYHVFDEGATMRGSYLKVTITYSGDDPIFIKNCITNFIQSYS